jgi:hypothetical protein
LVRMIACAACAVTLTAFYLPCAAKLPAPSDATKAQAAEAASKTAWNDKVGLYKTCLAMDRVAATYRADLKREGKEAPPPNPTPACSDPGPYTPTTPKSSKPLEASEAHSPPGAAVSPPSTNVPAAAAQGTQ